MERKLSLKARLFLNLCQRYAEQLHYLRKFSRRFPEEISNLDAFTMSAGAKDASSGDWKETGSGFPRPDTLTKNDGPDGVLGR
jgi:hypothetical protein